MGKRKSTDIRACKPTVQPTSPAVVHTDAILFSVLVCAESRVCAFVFFVSVLCARSGSLLCVQLFVCTLSVCIRAGAGGAL